MPGASKIHIIDDTPNNLKVLCDYLLENGFEVFVSMDGESGLEQIAQQRPDLILLDVMMPGIDGFETCERLKASTELKDIPVIFMTALSDTNEKIKAFGLGAVDYVTKPFNQEEVLARVSTHLMLRQLQTTLELKNQELQKAEEKYRSVFEHAVVGIFQSTSDGRLLTANPALARMLGYDSETDLMTTVTDLGSQLYLAPNRRAELLHALKTEGTVSNRESQVLRKDTSVMWISESIRTVHQPNGTVLYYEGFVDDITSRKSAEMLNTRLQAQNVYLESEIEAEHNYGEVITQSDNLKKILGLIHHVAPTDSTVLLEGETGSGKEVFARAIHHHSKRKDHPLVKVNCGAISAGLVESELFGHEKGAFTGATAKRIGRFELADGGTLFLDEIGELSPDIQVKLLRVLQEQEFERVGGSVTLRVNVRVIAATNRSLRDEVKAGTFRADLYYRLNIFPVQIPPLRERNEDIVLLANHFLKRFATSMGKPLERLSKASAARLQQYSWPGNVRELANVVERAAILAQTPIVDIEDLIDPPPISDNNLPAAGTLQDIERSYIHRILEEHNWILEGPQGAANVLGLNPSTLRFRMRKLGLTRPTLFS